MVAGVAPCNSALAAQLGISQHQQRQRPAPARAAPSKGGADEHAVISVISGLRKACSDQDTQNRTQSGDSDVNWSLIGIKLPDCRLRSSSIPSKSLGGSTVLLAACSPMSGRRAVRPTCRQLDACSPGSPEFWAHPLAAPHSVHLARRYIYIRTLVLFASDRGVDVTDSNSRNYDTDCRRRIESIHSDARPDAIVREGGCIELVL